MPEKLHSPPGSVPDLNNDENKKKWSKAVNGYIEVSSAWPDATSQFYDATKVEPENAVETAVVTWIGFPKQLRWPNDEERWQAADASRDVQDEYLEWSVKRNNDNKITKIVFSSEGPQYFNFVSENQPETLLALYQQHNTGAIIVEEDLYTGDGGERRYDTKNKWNKHTNTGTIMHLIHPENTLLAEVNIAAQATIVRERGDGKIITDAQELINSLQYDRVPDRNSDLQIVISCNNLVRELPRRLTINDPIGLYIHSVNWGMVDPPGGHEDDDPSTFWKWTRGSPGHYVRAEFEVPADKGYVVGDLRVNGKPLKYGAQLTDYIFISITARTSALAAPQPRAGSQSSNSTPAAHDASKTMSKISGMSGPGMLEMLRISGMPPSWVSDAARFRTPRV